MKVKCLKIRNPVTKKYESKNNWLTINKIYVVLSIAMPLNKTALINCLGDDNSTPIMCEIDQFETVCKKIPSNWIISLDKSGNLNIAPKKWLRDGFWEDYFNFIDEAEKDFKKDLEIIMAES